MIQAVIIGATAMICIGVIISFLNREKATRASTYSNGPSSYSGVARSEAPTGGEIRRRIFPSEDCVICMEGPPEVEIYPCSHKIVCEKCINQLMKQEKKVCPLCRDSIKGYNVV